MERRASDQPLGGRCFLRRAAMYDIRQSMCLADAADALDELADGRRPDGKCAMRGLEALNALLPTSGEPDLSEAAAVLDVFLATGMITFGVRGKSRKRALAAAVRRALNSSGPDTIGSTTAQGADGPPRRTTVPQRAA